MFTQFWNRRKFSART